MKTFIKRVAAGCGALLMLCAFTACKLEAPETLESSTEKSVLDSLTSPSDETTTAPENTQAPAGDSVKTESAVQLSYTIPEKFKKLFNTSFNDLFSGKDVAPIGAGSGTEVYESADYPGLKLHFDASKNFVTAIEGNISVLVPGKESLTFTEFKQIFGNDSIAYSEMTGGYIAIHILENKYKLMCGEFGDENGLITTFVLANTTEI